ncbi:50S ribosomal protein L33 [Paenibacillus sp. LMG 31461]|uniref:50S ribosomal protein L33 n=1 Tax=Paenibacillus plantarum TaxID=2654975 RepID=A0ABX1X2G2_9BACL|nr:50S ribosomal protein L33 [Paenibacillus plantarum]NOU62594.1 50S ribosomal protein L33 [Paenibacillus plantarum]
MTSQIRKEDVRNMVGKQIMALKKDGTSVSGKLVRISGNKLVIAPQKGEKVQVKAIIPLVLFDLLAIGTEPFAFGGFGGGFGGFGGFGGPGFWW